MTSPRTPRQLLGWTVPDHIDSGTIGRWVNVTCRHGICLGTPSASRSYYVPAMSVAAESAPFEVFLRSHAHGGEVTNALAPLSEVLSETPEPPQDDEALGNAVAEAFAALRADAKVYTLTEQKPRCGSCDHLVTDHGDGCYFTVTVGTIDGDPVCQCTVPASQSVPAVPVSSTGGPDSGEGDEDAQGAAEADWTEEARFADFREAYDYATIHFSTAIRAHAKVDRREAYQIWHTIQLGMEKIQRERSPLPDSETEDIPNPWTPTDPKEAA